MYTQHECDVMKAYSAMLEHQLPMVMEVELKNGGTEKGTMLIHYMLENIEYIWKEHKLDAPRRAEKIE